jgi:type IV secretory pathway VirJ component
MRATLGVLALLLVLASPLTHAQAVKPKAAPAQPELPGISHGLFSGIQMFRPGGPTRQFVILLSDNLSPNATELQMIRTMVDAGAMVAAVPVAPFYKKLEAQDGKCTYAPGAFENLSRHLQASEQLSTYLLPMLVGSGSAAAFAYAVLAQAPAGTFAAALSVGFCPRLAFATPMCVSNALRWQVPPKGVTGVELLPASSLTAPWSAVQAGNEAACTADAAQSFVQRVPQASWVAASPAVPAATSAFETAYTQLAISQVALAPPPSQLSDLPLVEEPVKGSGTRFAVLLSGDGGWAGIDKGLAAALVAQNVPVAGLDSLRYFWKARTPEGLASDLDRMIRYYADRWKRSEVILIGYSQGADVLPFAINRLPTATRASVKLAALLGPGQKASFEFHLSNWLGPSGDKPIAPEARKLSAANTVCVYGLAEKGSLCPQLAPAHARAMPLTGGHHFGGDYDKLADLLLEAAGR